MPSLCSTLTAAAIAAASASATATHPQQKRPQQQEKPHLVFMMADQLRWNTNGYAGGQENLTVNLDRLAAEGLEMQYSWSSTPTCTPARAAILTGQSPWNHGMLGYGAVAERYPVEMPRTIAKAGYVTAAFGKDHFGWNDTSNHGIDHGYASTLLYDGLGGWTDKKTPPAPHNWTGEFDDYDQWFEKEMPGKDPQATLDDLDGDGWNGWRGRAYVYDEYYHATAWVGREAVSFIQGFNSTPAGKAGLPYFLKISFHRPHSPYDPPERLLKQTLQRKLPEMVVSTDGWDDMFRGGPGDPPGCGPSNNDAWCGLMPANESAVSRAAYFASVQFVDEQIGLIYNALKEANHLENALILWTSDHGDGQGDHYHWRKGFPYEFSAHVPMLLRWPENDFRSIPKPKLPRGTTLKPPLVSELRDIFPTFLHATGVEGLVPDGHFTASDGQSLLCLLQDPTGQGASCEGSPNNSTAATGGPFWRQWLDMEHSTVYNASNHWSALTDGKIKYIFNADDASEQLFNLATDPNELVDLSKSPDARKTLELWRSRLVDQFQREGRGPDWVSANGTLMQRTKGQTYSPNFPAGPPPSAGDAVVSTTNGGQLPNCWVQEGDVHDNDTATLGLVAECEDSTENVTMSGFCLTRVASRSSHDGNASSLIIDVCDAQKAASPSQNFATVRSENGTSVVHVPTGQCATFPVRPATDVTLQDCDPPNDLQLFVFGKSGRLCVGDCIGVDATWSARGATQFEVAARDTPLGMQFVRIPFTGARP